MNIYSQLKKDIEQGGIKPGENIPIGYVCTVFECSRGTARHAVQLLETDGLVKRFPGCGYYVTEVKK